MHTYTRATKYMFFFFRSIALCSLFQNIRGSPWSRKLGALDTAMMWEASAERSTVGASTRP